MIAKSQRAKPPRTRQPKLIVSSTFKHRLRDEETKEHIESMRTCFPDWHGPKVTDNCDGYCEVEGYCCGGRFLHAPVLITRVSLYIIEGVIAYEPDAPDYCRSENGTPLRLHITDIWPPVWLLNPLKEDDQRVAHIKDE